MMKRLTIALMVTFFAMSVSAQRLIDVYKKGVVKLIPDADYAQGNNWDKIFETYSDTLYGKPMGNRKSLVIMPDGSVVINHAYKNYYTKFSPTGKFEKEFGVKSAGGQQFKKINHIAGIINNNTFYSGLDNMGKMVCFDFNGNFIKSLKLDYMTKQMIALPNKKIAVVGWVIWETKFRDFVAIVDYETNSQKVIWEQYTDRCPKIGECSLFNYGYTFKERGAISIGTMPFTKETGLSSPPQIASVGNQLIVTIPTTGEIRVYDINGSLKSTDKIGWATNYISVDEQKVIQQKAIDKFKTRKPVFADWVSPEENKLAYDHILNQMEADLNKISVPIPIPVFSTIIKDSDGNLLFFEFPKEENANKFNVWIYENNGKFVCQSSFDCERYNLEINPSKMVFHNGYIYALQVIKNGTGIPLRLVRFKIV